MENSIRSRVSSIASRDRRVNALPGSSGEILAIIDPVGGSLDSRRHRRLALFNQDTQSG
jgi:hypothetical protein